MRRTPAIGCVGAAARAAAAAAGARVRERGLAAFRGSGAVCVQGACGGRRACAHARCLPSRLVGWGASPAQLCPRRPECARSAVQRSARRAALRVTLRATLRLRESGWELTGPSRAALPDPRARHASSVAARVKSPLMKSWLKMQATLFAPVTTLLVALGWQVRRSRASGACACPCPVPAPAPAPVLALRLRLRLCAMKRARARSTAPHSAAPGAAPPAGSACTALCVSGECAAGWQGSLTPAVCRRHARRAARSRPPRRRVAFTLVAASRARPPRLFLPCTPSSVRLPRPF